MTEPLSPAAQAVLDAVCDNTEPDCDTQHLIAAALRAILVGGIRTSGGGVILDGNFVLAIAAELGAQP